MYYCYRFFPPASAVEGIRLVPSVCPCIHVSVCLSVSALTAEPFELRTLDIAFGNISDEFEGQGHRSKVRVVILNNLIFRCFYGVTCVDWTEPSFVMTYHVM